MSLAAGTKLGAYEIIGLLGAGGMGEVYRARDPHLGRDVAIKILPASFARDPDRLRRFEQEARAAAALNHPNILAVYQLGTHEGSPYLVSELLEGGTLREKLGRGPLVFRKAVDYGVQTARGLAAAHEKGIVHRDLKPENLFVTNDGRLKILDFGLAKLIQKPQEDGLAATVSGHTDPGVVLGTVGYMVPEQVRGQSADHRADLFALGAILYEMLTGKRSFRRPTSAETMTAILNDEPPAISTIVPDTPPALQRVVQRCLEKNPEQRFHSAYDLAFALESLSDPGGSWSGGQQAVKESNFAWWKIAVGIVVVAIVAATVMLWFSRPAAVPVVESVTQLTNDPNAKSGSIETDGARAYFNQGPSGSYKIAQVSVNGGQTAEVATPLSNPTIVGLSGDGSSLLVLVSRYIDLRSQMWSLPLPAGEPRRLGETDVDDASIFPDGHLIFADADGLYVADKDGSKPRKLDGLSKYDAAPNISPDGKRMVFSSYDRVAGVSVLHETLSDGTGMRDVLKGGTQGLPAQICCGHWTRITWSFWG